MTVSTTVTSRHQNKTYEYVLRTYKINTYELIERPILQAFLIDVSEYIYAYVAIDQLCVLRSSPCHIRLQPSEHGNLKLKLTSSTSTVSLHVCIYKLCLL